MEVGMICRVVKPNQCAYEIGDLVRLVEYYEGNYGKPKYRCLLVEEDKVSLRGKVTCMNLTHLEPPSVEGQWLKEEQLEKVAISTPLKNTKLPSL